MRFFLLALILFFVTDCSTQESSPELHLEGVFSSASLEGISINSLDQFEGNRYAATDSGLYSSSSLENNNSWNPLGLQDKSVVNIVFLPQSNFLAAVNTFNFNGGIPSLFLSDDNGENWQPWINNYGGETGEYTAVGSLTAISKPSDTLFVRGGGGATVARSLNGGKEWQVVNGSWNLYGGAAVLVFSDPYTKGRIFAGGVGAFSSPYLLVSTNFGNTWSGLNILESIEAVCYDVVTHPVDKNIILAGLSGTVAPANIIRKSTNGGESWSTAMQNIGTLTLAQGARNPKIVYASGINQNGTLFFLASGDFGDTWETVEFEGGPNQIRVNDMISVLQNGKEVLYFGTNKGVYSYTLEN